MGIPVGIGGGDQDKWKLLRFDVKCDAKLVRANKPELEIPISGLVFADAETMSLHELYRIVPDKVDSAEPVNWSLLEYHKAAGDPVDMSVRKLQGRSGLANSKLQNLDQDRGIEVTNEMRDSSTDPFATPTFYVSNSNGAYFELKTKGGNYIAIGVMVGVDLGDGPKSYGQAGAIGQPLVSGNLFGALDTVTNDSYLKLSDPKFNDPKVKAKVEGAPDSYLGENGPDLETLFVDDDSWTTLQNDDKAYYTSPKTSDESDDEDAVSGPLITAAYPGKHELTIKCEPSPTQGETTNVSAWIDWNADGKFTETERYNTTCSLASKSAKLVWDVNSTMTPSKTSPDIAPSLLRLIATTQDVSTFEHNSLVENGEVEDHAVTLIRPAINVTKKIVNTNGQDVPTAKRDGFKFTADTPGISFLEKNLTATQTTDKQGRASWRMKFTSEKIIPITTDVNTITKLASPIEATITEAVNNAYRNHQHPVCQLLPKASWVDTPPVGEILADGEGTQPTVNQPGTYAWPANTPLAPKVLAHNAASAAGVEFQFTPSSAVECNFVNQPFAQISVKPTIDGTHLKTTPTYDQNLRFSGTYTCTPPTTGTDADKAPVTGTWGPVAAGEVWKSDPAQSHIIPGSSCTFKQTKISSQNTTENALPVANSALYYWKNKTLDPVEITANAVLAGETLTEAKMINPVAEREVAGISWRSVNEASELLRGSVFTVKVVSPDGAESNISDIADCAADTADACTGLDQDPRAGYFKLTEIPVGTYEIKETTTPAGYDPPNTLEGEITIEEMGKTKAAGDAIHPRISADVLPQLPITGGLGTYIFVLFGVGIIAVATFGGITVYQRREKGGSN
ncbi:CshA/CshB family fibrillar adhesin-related protein [Arcanobacterium hippocoleae]|uniref:CshA/CshB family fibrillar adhesin-related protein n=1 Tax=Arcanobacterium hippocoleae TaxID=149017 RepID=UPI003340E6F1